MESLGGPEQQRKYRHSSDCEGRRTIALPSQLDLTGLSGCPGGWMRTTMSSSPLPCHLLHLLCEHDSLLSFSGDGASLTTGIPNWKWDRFGPLSAMVDQGPQCGFVDEIPLQAAGRALSDVMIWWVLRFSAALTVSHAVGHPLLSYWCRHLSFWCGKKKQVCEPLPRV